MWLNGDRYDGEVRLWRRDGGGEFVGGDGAVYVGGWVGDKKEGRGTLAYASGESYEGEWVNDKAEGGGRFLYRDGVTFYEGGWKGGAMHGTGVVCVDGEVRGGVWADGEETSV